MWEPKVCLSLVAGTQNLLEPDLRISMSRILNSVESATNKTLTLRKETSIARLQAILLIGGLKKSSKRFSNNPILERLRT